MRHRVKEYRAGDLERLYAKLGIEEDFFLVYGFVTRPMEFGPDGKPDLQANGSVDVAARDFNDLATKLGA